MKVNTQAIILEYGKNEKDAGNINVQLALLTGRINHLSEHLKTYKKDYANTHALLKLVGKRRKMLKYYKNANLLEYRNLISKLGLRH